MISSFSNIADPFYIMFQQAAVASALVSMEGRVMASNEAMTRLLGYELEELQAHAFWSNLSIEDDTSAAGMLQQLVEGHAFSFHRNARCRQKNGQVIWLSVNLSLARNSEGESLIRHRPISRYHGAKKNGAAAPAE